MGGKINLLKKSHRIAYFINLLITLVLYSNFLMAQDKDNSKINKQYYKTTNQLLLEQNKKILIEDADFSQAKSLNPIEIRMNIIDALMVTKNFNILSGKHEGLVNNNYQNFYSLRISYKEVGENIQLDIKLLNWVTQFKHRQMTKSLNKQNFLFNFRLSIYQLIYGQQYFLEHQDELEKLTTSRVNALKARPLSLSQQKILALQVSKNKKDNIPGDIQNNNIQKVSAKKPEIPEFNNDTKPKSVDKEVIPRFVPIKDQVSNIDNAKSVYQKKIEKLKDEVLDNKEETQNEDKSTISNQASSSQSNNVVSDEDDKFEKVPEIYYLKKAAKAKTKRKNEKKYDKDNTNKTNTVYASRGDSLFPVLPKEVSRDEKKAIESADTVNYLNITAKFIDEFTQSVALVDIKTHLTFFALGLDFAFHEIAEEPFLFHIKAEFGTPILIDTKGYEIPTWKKLLVGGFIRDWQEVFNIGPYLEYTSIYFVNLREVGSGLTIDDNNMLWAQLYLGKEFTIFSLPFHIHLNYSQSIIFQSEKDSITLSGSKLGASFLFPVWTNIGIELQHHQISLKGQQGASTISLESVNNSLTLRYAF